MYRTLFQLTVPALLGWALLILLPRWSVTRRAAESDIFPAYLAILYLLGAAPLLVRIGPGLVRAVADPAGAARLLSIPELAALAWIHILTFDQVAGLMMYRDNMRHGWVSVPAQSLLLLLTLVLGPVGFLGYWALRLPRKLGRESPAVESVAARLRTRLLSRLAGERLLLRTAGAILVLAFFLGALLGVNGRTIPPAGDLARATLFAAALSSYLLMLATLAGPAALDGPGGRRWRALVALAAGVAAAIDAVETLRGLNPRFPAGVGAVERVLGVAFLADAGLLLALFGILAGRFLAGRDRGGPLLRAAVRYAAAGSLAGLFGAGALVLARGALVPPAGSYLPLHVLGLGAALTVPAVAGLFRLAETPPEAALPWVHASGLGWLFGCAAVAWQAGLGGAPLEGGFPNALAALCFGIWMLAAGQAALAWRIRVRWEARANVVSPDTGPPEPALELLEPVEAGGAALRDR